MPDVLPAEPKINDQILRNGSKGLKVYFAATGWGRTEWIGEVYPSGAHEREFLQYYRQYFNAIELNAGFVASIRIK